MIKSLKEHNINIPDEFGVIGFANESFDEFISPALSSVDQQTVQMGKEAFNLLMGIIQNKDGMTNVRENEKIVLEPILCYRESTAGKKSVDNPAIYKMLTIN